MKVSLYIKGKRLNLYDDESIQLVSKLNDIEKLSNIFTDFSQSFTIPADENNNAVFNHYYDMDIDNTFNANIRVEAYIELNTIPFRLGVIQLEAVSVKNNRPDNYKITFYGGLRQLTDLFGDDLIGRLDYKKDIFGVETKEWNSLSQFNYDYTSANFRNSVAEPISDGNILTPLIVYANRDIGIKTIDAITDITVNEGAILESELRPSIRLYPIIEAIETKYDITFSRDFLNRSQFRNIFMWMNNKEFTFNEEKLDVVISNDLTGTPNAGNVIRNGNLFTITRQRYTDVLADNYVAGVKYQLNTSLGANYDAFLVDPNGNVIAQWLNQLGSQTFEWTWQTEFLTFADTSITIDTSFKLQIVPKNTMSFDANVNITYKRTEPAMVVIMLTNLISQPNENEFEVKVKVEETIPELKVIDFLGAIMKAFKLVIRPITSNSFYLDTIDSFYNKGNILNITEYVDIEEISYERPLVYKQIDFKFEETENVLGKKFRETNNGVGYGDLKTVYPQIQGETLEVKLPFENMIWENLTYESGDLIGNSSNIVVGQSSSLNDNQLSANSSKPILFYNCGIIKATEPFKVKYRDSVGTVLYYNLCLNIDDERLNQVTQSLNWGSENDPFLLTRIDNSLYQNYWSNWINTIYDLKQRKVTMTANLPDRFIDELSLNDRLIVGSNRFKIQEYNINLLSGETKLTLFKDVYSFFPPQPKVNVSPIIMNSGSKYFTIPINGVESEWLANIDYLGVEEDWIEFTTLNQGEDNGYLTIKVLDKVFQTPPLVFEDRQAILTIEVDGVDYVINITQLGLEE